MQIKMNQFDEEERKLYFDKSDVHLAIRVPNFEVNCIKNMQ